MIYRLDAAIWIDVPDTRDPEELASDFNSGLHAAVSHYPHGDVLKADVSTVHAVSDEEARDEGLTED